jgi:hypothetical protein
MIKKNVLIVLLLISNLHLFAQDYVIKATGDTIKGTILRSDISMLKIQPLSGKSFKLYPLDVKEFRRDGALFLSRAMYRKYGNEQQFIGVEIEGKVNLLSIGGSAPVMMSTGGGGMMMTGGGGRGTYYVEKNGAVTVLQDVITGAFSGEKRLNEVRNLLLAVMGDDAEIAEKINQTVYFSGKVVRKLVEDYNRKHH